VSEEYANAVVDTTDLEDEGSTGVLSKEEIIKRIKYELVPRFVNYFGEVGGFTAIANLFTAIDDKNRIPTRTMHLVARMLLPALELVV
jgi:hypothetical protein